MTVIAAKRRVKANERLLMTVNNGGSKVFAHDLLTAPLSTVSYVRDIQEIF